MFIVSFMVPAVVLMTTNLGGLSSLFFFLDLHSVRTMRLSGVRYVQSSFRTPYKVVYSFQFPQIHDEVLKGAQCQEFARHDEGPDLDSQASQVQDMPSYDQAQEAQDDQVPIGEAQPQVGTDDPIKPQATSNHAPLLLQELEEPFSPDSDPDPLHFVDPWDFLLTHPEGLPHPNSEPPLDLGLGLGLFDFESESLLEWDQMQVYSSL
ncbi:uncharacterized protein EV420DRAFT_106411 [Desarmillaria tabescens]|uniref:Uncharacterized protein n=1 Tax=Armillaria tabescens TaxID=1929756 RepID=A0AA39NR43_ARMTA|nr:uncharacterized protein EV420DRAFT_106411 [Desarmillaria tabescens]KAK0470319.1 hypothetical protein EV420DRAFT_106411 [Desarmillaria tabescens]